MVGLGAAAARNGQYHSARTGQQGDRVACPLLPQPDDTALRSVRSDRRPWRRFAGASTDPERRCSPGGLQLPSSPNSRLRLRPRPSDDPLGRRPTRANHLILTLCKRFNSSWYLPLYPKSCWPQEKASGSIDTTGRSSCLSSGSNNCSSSADSPTMTPASPKAGYSPNLSCTDSRNPLSERPRFFPLGVPPQKAATSTGVNR